MGKVLLSVLLVGFLAGCAGFANERQFAPFPVQQPDSAEAEASAAEPDDGGGGFSGGVGGDLGGGLGGGLGDMF